jgi:WD40 repeat protein
MSRLRFMVLAVIVLGGCSPSKVSPPASPTISATLPTPSEPPSPSPMPTPTPPRAHAPTKLPTGLPKTFVALTTTGDIVIGSTARGGVIRVIATAAQLGTVSGPSPSPDGKTIYFTKRLGESCFEAWSVQTSNGKLRKIARGGSPVVSPDGKRLVYSESENCGRRTASVTVRTISNGSERVWKYHDEIIGGFGPATWGPDGHKLLVDGCGADSCSTFVLDPSKRGDDLSGPEFYPDTVYGFESTSLSFTSLVVRGRRGTVLFDVSDTGGGEAPPGVFEYNPQSGKTKVLFKDERRFNVLDADASGFHLLYFDEHDELLGWSDGKSIRIGPGYASAEW